MQFEFTLTGITPLLMHADDVEKADELMEWRKHPDNKNKSKAGDDRTPPWTWMTYAYYDEEGKITMPQECIMAALSKAGAQFKLKGNTTFKSLSQSGLLIHEEFCNFTTNGNTITTAQLSKFKDADFKTHCDEAKKLGFELFVKRATIGQSKHVRVRPKFKNWQITGHIETLASEFTEAILTQMMELCGLRVGLGDWRPSAPSKPGRYGKFSCNLVKV